jgi:hypothetical protein
MGEIVVKMILEIQGFLLAQCRETGSLSFGLRAY